MNVRTIGAVIALAIGLLMLDVWGALSPCRMAFAKTHSLRQAQARQLHKKPPPTVVHLKPQKIAHVTPRRRTNTVRSGQVIVRRRPPVRSTGRTFKPSVVKLKQPVVNVTKNKSSGGQTISNGPPGTGSGTTTLKTGGPGGKTVGLTSPPLKPRNSLNNNSQNTGKLGRGPGKPFAAGSPRFPVIKLAGGAFPFVSGPKRIFRDGRWHSFVPFTTLGVLAIGSSYYYPSAYVSAGRRVCTGLTPDGCQLNWQLIGFDGGGNAFQCVQYCPRPGLTPPPSATRVALTPPPPPVARGACELAIFAEPNFGGATSEVTGDQPSLAESGWQNEIASIQIKSGTWDFFVDDGFSGESMRLHAGSHPRLGPEWSKRIGSFQCILGS